MDTNDTSTATESTATEWEWVQGFGWVERKVQMAEVVEIRPEQDDDRKRA